MACWQHQSRYKSFYQVFVPVKIQPHGMDAKNYQYENFFSTCEMNRVDFLC